MAPMSLRHTCEFFVARQPARRVPTPGQVRGHQVVHDVGFELELSAPCLVMQRM